MKKEGTRTDQQPAITGHNITAAGQAIQKPQTNINDFAAGDLLNTEQPLPDVYSLGFNVLHLLLQKI